MVRVIAGIGGVMLLLITASLALARRSEPPARLAFLGAYTDIYGLYTMTADGTHVRPIAAHLGSPLRRPSWSPDGTSLVFGGGSVYQLAPGDDQPHILLAGESYQLPEWSPDGAYLLVRGIGDPDHPTTTPIYTLDPAHGTLTLIAEGDDPAWSPDGQWIAYAAGPSSAARHIYRIRPDGTEREQLTVVPGLYHFPVWSPDGTRIALAYDVTALGVMAANGGPVHTVVPPDVAFVALNNFAWSPDGEWLVYATWANTPDESGIFRARVGGRTVEQIAGWMGMVEQLSPSPEGDWLVFTANDNWPVLYRMRWDGRDLRQLTPSAFAACCAAWGPIADRSSGAWGLLVLAVAGAALVVGVAESGHLTRQIRRMLHRQMRSKSVH